MKRTYGLFSFERIGPYAKLWPVTYDNWPINFHVSKYLFKKKSVSKSLKLWPSIIKNLIDMYSLLCKNFHYQASINKKL